MEKKENQNILREKLDSMYEEAESYKCNSVTSTYDRALYEDRKKMEECKADFYDGRKQQIDPQTGNMLHQNVQAAKRKYGDANYTKHIGNPDHEDPLNKIHERNRNKRYLCDDDIKEIGNRPNNLSLKQERANKSKGNDYNLDAIKNPNKVYGEDFGTFEKIEDVIKGEALKKETDVLLSARSTQRAVKVHTADAIKHIDTGVQNFSGIVKNTSNQISNSEIYKLEKGAVKESSGAMTIAAISSIAENVYFVSQGTKDENEAVEDVASTVAKVGTTTFVQRNVKEITSRVSQKVMSKSVNPIRETSKVGCLKGTSGELMSVSVSVAEQFAKYCKDEITSDEMIELCSQIVATELIGFIGENIAQVIPGIGMIPGARYVGRIIAITLYQSTVILKKMRRCMQNRLFS